MAGMPAENERFHMLDEIVCQALPGAITPSSLSVPLVSSQCASDTAGDFLSQPLAIYDAQADQINFLTSEEDFTTSEVDPQLRSYQSRQTGEFIGAQIIEVRKLIRELTKQLPGFELDLASGRLHLAHLFAARLWAVHADAPQTQAVYQKLRNLAEKCDASVEFHPLD